MLVNLFVMSLSQDCGCRWQQQSLQLTQVSTLWFQLICFKRKLHLKWRKNICLVEIITFFRTEGDRVAPQV